MSKNFVGVTFAEQRVTPSDDAKVRRVILSDGFLNGCELSYTGSTLSMAAGDLLLLGRQISHPTAQNWAIADATSGYARLVLTVDLSRASTQSAFDQVVDTIEYATSVDGFAALRQDNINGSGAKYQVAACVVSLGSNGIAGIVKSLGNAALNVSIAELSRMVDTTGNFARMPVICATLAETGLTKASATTQTVMDAMPLNSVVFFSHAKEHSVRLMDAPTDYGIVVLQKGAGANYNRAMLTNPHGGHYLYKYHPAVEKGNGWAKILTSPLTSDDYGSTLPAPGTPGRIFFKKVT